MLRVKLAGVYTIYVVRVPYGALRDSNFSPSRSGMSLVYQMDNVKKFPLEYDNGRLQKLEEALRLREHEIHLLKETADAIISERHLGTLLQTVAERTRDLIQAEIVLIPTINKECTEYTYRAGAGRDAEEIIGESLPLELGICGWVWRHRKAWWEGVFGELSEEERNRWKNEVGTIIMVPLFGKEHFLGGISGLNKIGGKKFDKRDLDLLSMLASQAAIAVENATAFEELQKEKSRVETFQEELQVLNKELLKTNRDLEHMALYDSLTGLPNRHVIQDRLQQGLYGAARDSRPLSLLMVDLDRFKEVNDTLGHHVGDELLKQVGMRFQKQFRQVDTVGRLGGDEFAVVVPKTGSEGALKVAAHLHKALDEPFNLDEGSYRVGASIGIAVYPDHGDDVSTLFKRADIAMYVAKQRHNSVAIYDAEIDQHTRGRLSLMGDLHQALDLNQLELFYQPKLDLGSKTIVGVEALMRWHHPEHGMVPPDVFIPALEQSGILKRYTYWALATAAAQCRAWNDQGWDLSVSVNLSMYNLHESGLPEQIERCRCENHLRPNTLIMEVTESAVMSDPHHVSAVLDELVACGIQLSIDDFGTGYSSLGHLKRLPVSELKIDKSFVLDMGQDTDDAIIVRSTIDLAHNMGLRVVAEGVENEGCLAMLQGMSCDVAQGFFIARPMPAAKLSDWLTVCPWLVARIKSGV
jgi:diguanylate cyclase (GGDEF)-like protein